MSKQISIRSAFAFLTAILFATVANGQNPTPTPRISEETEVIKVDSRLIVVPVSVTNQNGEPVTGLTVADFRVLEGGRNQEIESVGGAEVIPLEIALLVDVSASTDAMFKFQQETAAKFLRDVMRPDDRATIITVGAKPAVVRSRETADIAATVVAGITPTKEQTAFYDSVKFAADLLRQTSPEGRRRVIVLISDGEDTNSDGVLRAIWNAERNITDNIAGSKLRELRVKARDGAKVREQEKVVKALQDADSVLFAINPAGSSLQLNSMSVFGQQNMERFAKETGGTAFLPKFQPIDTPDYLANDLNRRRNTELLARIFTQLANELRAQYLIQYYSDGDYPDGQFVNLSVQLTRPSAGKVRARDGYFVRN